MPDPSGTPYAQVADTEVGSWLTAGPYFHDLPEGYTTQVYLANDPISPRLAVLGTAGDHALTGQLGFDGRVHGGVSRDGTEYLGFYAGEEPSGSTRAAPKPPGPGKQVPKPAAKTREK